MRRSLLQGGDLALQLLCSDDVAAALRSSTSVLGKVHSVLWHRAAHCFETGRVDVGRQLFSAAYQYAPPEQRCRGARAIAACHARLGSHQSALEWLDIAVRHEQDPSSLTQLMRLEQQLLLPSGSAEQVIIGGEKWR